MSVETHQDYFSAQLEKLPVSQEDKNILEDGFKFGFVKPQDLIPEFVGRFSRRVKVAFHEIAHELEARWNGHHVIESSVIQNGNTLGYVSSVDTKPRPLADSLRRRARIFMAGRFGEEKRGQTDHRGAGYDYSVVDHIARLHESITGVKASKFVSEQMSIVREHIMSVDSEYFKFKAHKLAFEGSTTG